MTTDETFDELLNYILNDPDPDLDVSVQYKYPSRACEVLTCEIPELTAKLAEKDEYIDRILRCINFKEHIATHLQASFCVKLISHLYKNRIQRLYDYISDRTENVLEVILSSLHLPCLSDMLLQMSSPIEDIDSTIPPSEGFLLPLIKAGLFNKLLDNFFVKETSDSDSDAVTNTAFFCCEIIRAGPSTVSSQLLTSEFVKKLFSAMFPVDSVSTVPEFVLFHGFGIINTILSEDNDTDDFGTRSDATIMVDFDEVNVKNDGDDSEEQSQDHNNGHAPLGGNRSANSKKPKRSEHFKFVIDALLSNIANIKALLHNAPSQFPQSKLCLSCQQADFPPLGRLRLRIVATIHYLVDLHEERIDNALAENEILKSLLEIFLQYKWNSLLHNLVERITCSILSSSLTDPPLLKRLLSDCGFVHMVLDSYQDNQKQGNLCPGYSGQLLQMANQFAKAVENSKNEVSKYVSVEDMENWKKFEIDTLNEVNEKNKPDRMSTGGSGPSHLLQSLMLAQHLPHRGARNGVPEYDDDDDDDEEMESFDQREEGEHFVESVLQQIQIEYHKEDLTGKPISSFSSALSCLELDPQKAILGDLPHFPPSQSAVVPGGKDNGSSSDDEEMHEHDFEETCSSKIGLSKQNDSDDELWRDVEQGNFEPAKKEHAKHIFEDSQGNVSEVKESEWNPFQSSEAMEEDSRNSSSNSERNSSSDEGDSPGKLETSDFAPFADFNAASGSEWPGTSTNTSENCNNDWPGTKMETSPPKFEVNFEQMENVKMSQEDSSEKEEVAPVSSNIVPPPVPPRAGEKEPESKAPSQSS